VDNNGRRLMANERFMELLCIPPELMSEVDDRRMLDYVVSLIGNPESFRGQGRISISASQRNQPG